jgi:hypothetical protein
MLKFRHSDKSCGCELVLVPQLLCNYRSPATHPHSPLASTRPLPACLQGASEAFDMVYSGGKPDDITVMVALVK